MSRVVEYRIVISENATDNEKRAANFLKNNIRLVCGELVPIVCDSEEAVDKEIVVGVTNRERTGFIPERSRKGLYQYVIKGDGKRVFICGLGVPDTPPEAYTSAYRYTDEGDIGTLMGVYRFVEDILGYSFIYDGYAELVENKEATIPENCLIEYTNDSLKAKRIPLFDGEAMYMLPVTEQLDWNIMSFVFKTKNGRLIVIDGGHAEETDNLLDALRQLTPDGSVPVVSAWFLTHLHADHYGAFSNIVEHYEDYRDKVKVENFYCNLLEEEFYTTLSKEAGEWCKAVRDAILTSNTVLGCKVHNVATGDTINIDGVQFKVIHTPDMKYAELMNMNDSSVVYKMTASCGQTFMFLGDAEWVCDNDLLENLRNKAERDDRSLSSYINLILRKYIEASETKK